MSSKPPVRSCGDVDETALSYAEIKALCAGNPLLREKMDLDIEVARLRLLKSDHQSQRYHMEDQLLRYFPENIERSRGRIAGYDHDIEMLKSNAPNFKEHFPSMEVNGVSYDDKSKAGAALLEACRKVSQEQRP